MRQSAVSFKAKGLNFEGIVGQPDGDSGPFPAVVICHPHPLFGGNMDNNVVLAVSFALVDQGFAIGPDRPSLSRRRARTGSRPQ